MSMTAEDYRRLVRRYPRPTPKQMHRFADHLSDAHSWYKKLPFDGAGEPFFVYLAPNVHRVRVSRPDGSHAARDIVFDGSGLIRRARVAVQPDDIYTEQPGLDYYAAGLSTQQYHDFAGRWKYWNWGPPDQPRDEAIADASARVVVMDDDGEATAVPAEVLGLGLVYLRATMSPMLLPDDAARLRTAEGRGLPSHARQRREQLGAMVTAMKAVVAWAYD